jgi:alpha-tubulin suppressor-like RCC1 family protein
VRPDGTVACWGANPYGGTTAPAGTFSQVAAADWFSCGLRSGGSVECWGGWYWTLPPGNGYVQLEAGRAQVCGRRNDGTVACGGVDQFGQASAPAGAFSTIAAGGDTSCGIRTNGGPVVCWGDRPFPDGVAGPYGLGSLAAGWNHSCQRAAKGNIACWGSGTEGQTSPPAGNFAELEVGERNTCALTAAGGVQCWGRNVEAQNSAPAGPFKALRMAPYGGCALRPTGAIACWGLNNYGQATPPAGTYRAVDAGYFHACAINSAGGASCWGLNTEGQASAPAGTFRDIAVGDYHSCGLRADGGIVCWGRNTNGQSTPPAGNYVAVASGRFHGCAIGTTGSLTCWGANDAGQATPPASGRYVSVTAGMSHSCAVRDDGVRICWGSDAAGANPALVLSPASLPGAVHGNAYATTQFSLTAANYTPSTMAYGVVSGALPPGLALSSSGALSGTPTSVGTFSFTVEGEDANGFVGSRAYSLAVADPTPPVITPSVTGTLGNNGWYRSDVDISWTVNDAESAIASSSGCTASTLSTDSPGAGYTCSATSAGGTASQTATVKRDTTLPTISSTATPAPNASGWYNASVTLAYACADATSGVASCPADDIVSSNGTGVLSPARSATDLAGNSRAVVRRALNIDTIAPETTLDATPPSASISADATFAFSATDALSGVDRLECSLDGATFATCGSPLNLQGLADGSHTFKVRSVDVAGTMDATPAQYTWTVDVDTTPPVITPSVSGTLGDNGWYVGNVTVSFNVSENDTYFTGMTGCNTVVVSTDTPGASFTCTASSPGGTASKSVTVKLDKTAPQISAAPTTAANAAGWYRDDVVAAYTCEDALSGVVACPSNQVITGEGAAVASAPRTVTDAAGNVSAPASITVKIDRTPPALAVGVEQPLLLHAEDGMWAFFSDNLSGPAPGGSCTPLETSTIGVKTVTCTAIDKAGNTGSASTDYRVSYGFAGFEAPLDNAWNGVRIKQYLPFKWRVFDANNADVANLASFNVTRATVACPAGITPVAVTAYGNSNTSLQYLGGGRYQRNWLLSTGLPGSCVRIDVELGDGVKHAVMVKL